MKYHHNLIIGPSKYIYFNKKGKKKYFKKVLKNRKLEKNAIRDEIDKKN
jgi:hypothetical protein